MAADSALLARPRWWTAHLALPAVLGALILLPLVLVGLSLMGLQALIVRSGSMSPAIETGDVIFIKRVHPGDVKVGDIVTFPNPARADALLTHRVVSVTPEGGSFFFVTRGDRNTAEEKWTIDVDGTVGLFRLRVGGVGYALAWLGGARVRAVLITMGALVFGFTALRRIGA